MPATTLFGEYVQNLPRLSTELEEFDPAAAAMEASADWDELARLALAGEIAELTRLAEVQHVSQLDAKAAHLATSPSVPSLRFVLN
jgi:hypothetical protein